MASIVSAKRSPSSRRMLSYHARASCKSWPCTSFLLEISKPGDYGMPKDSTEQRFDRWSDALLKSGWPNATPSNSGLRGCAVHSAEKRTTQVDSSSPLDLAPVGGLEGPRAAWMSNKGVSNSRTTYSFSRQFLCPRRCGYID
jgi:hypothetical protein